MLPKEYFGGSISAVTLLAASLLPTMVGFSH
jgi:hypothetical protein